MADPAQNTPEPSMEEILASIRRIISDEVPPPVSAEPAPSLSVEGDKSEEDILELTQIVQEDGAVVDFVEPALSPPAVFPPTPALFEPSLKTESLVSSPAAQTAASALSSLAQTVEIERLATTPLGVTALGNGGRTLEDMVIELMRPLLKDWLDQNLPPLVERLVQREIERIARRS